MGRGAAFADYDNDGDADIVIVNIDSGAVLLRNDGGNKNHALALRLVGSGSNRDGVGAVVRVTSDAVRNRITGGRRPDRGPVAFGKNPATERYRRARDDHH
jgi:hypothetical protein